MLEGEQYMNIIG